MIKKGTFTYNLIIDVIDRLSGGKLTHYDGTKLAKLDNVKLGKLDERK